MSLEALAATHSPYITTEDLRWATKVAEQLTQRGIGIYTGYHNGRRMVLQVERNPDFAATQIAMIRRTPVMGGCERLYAANHLGVQIQWTVFEPATLSLVTLGVANG